MNATKAKWIEEFNRESPSELQTAIKLTEKETVEVFLNWNCDNGEFLCAVDSVEIPGFWFTAFDDGDEARKFCSEMGWIIKGENDRCKAAAYYKSIGAI